jgi:hypothetical protein
VSWGRVDGSGWTRIRDDGGVWAVAVSHRGDDIAFMHERGLWVMRADGADPRRLVEHTISPNTPTPLWSPDDRRLAYFHREGRTTEELRAIDLESGAITTLRQDARMSNAMGAASAAWLGGRSHRLRHARRRRFELVAVDAVGRPGATKGLSRARPSSWSTPRATARGWPTRR